MKIKIFSAALILSGFFLMIISSCKKPKTTTPVIETGTVTDIEGHVYKTVKIGNQWWMAENLKVKRYQDSSLIINVPNYQNTTWDTIKSGAWCLYDDNTNAPGRLYNWYAVNDPRKIAPRGWHVPNDAEWKALEEYLGMTDADATGWRGSNEGEKLKIASSQLGWISYSGIWSTNESGFTALAGSCRIYDGTWGDPGLFSTGFWWTSTNDNQSNQAWYRYLDYKNANVFRSHVQKNYGFSIRCVKD